eukprot:gnl/Dysnectes_brevis/4175_a5509_997.p1 GENE.gnl/Dysnectes_brevis/4175_a5509_997~~gnl/Dysnectes_brevis/4175_a5509_997.p1  ORF type:complete len:315 (+),score=32.25 gnl/Dysnectes_brevis/4175_a5509_997:39-983(+)
MSERKQKARLIKFDRGITGDLIYHSTPPPTTRELILKFVRMPIERRREIRKTLWDPRSYTERQADNALQIEWPENPHRFINVFHQIEHAKQEKQRAMESAAKGERPTATGERPPPSPPQQTRRLLRRSRLTQRPPTIAPSEPAALPAVDEIARTHASRIPHVDMPPTSAAVPAQAPAPAPVPVPASAESPSVPAGTTETGITPNAPHQSNLTRQAVTRGNTPATTHADLPISRKGHGTLPQKRRKPSMEDVQPPRKRVKRSSSQERQIPSSQDLLKLIGKDAEVPSLAAMDSHNAYVLRLHILLRLLSQPDPNT